MLRLELGGELGGGERERRRLTGEGWGGASRDAFSPFGNASKGSGWRSKDCNFQGKEESLSLIRNPLSFGRCPGACVGHWSDQTPGIRPQIGISVYPGHDVCDSLPAYS